jgi:hypothetical protein
MDETTSHFEPRPGFAQQGKPHFYPGEVMQNRKGKSDIKMSVGNPHIPSRAGKVRQEKTEIGRLAKFGLIEQRGRKI